MKRILTVVLAAVMLAVGANAAFEKVNTYNNDFSDVTNANWFYENVKTAYELGFMNGKSEGKFDPNGNVTVVEAITMASRLHAIYNGTEVKKSDSGTKEYRIDFDDPEILVDLSQRNSRNTHGVNPYKATAKIEDGVLVVEAVKQPNGGYDPQLQFNGLELPAKDYDKVTVRMKRDPLDDLQRSDYIEFFYTTNIKPAVSGDRQINISYYKLQNLDEWFEISQDVGKHSQWTDIITGFRFDPSNDGGIYYIDYIVFSKSENIKNEKWYDMYVDYAIENGIIKNNTFKTSEYTRNITRAEICDLFALAIPEEHFNPINDVKGIPDVLRDSENADIYLTLYKAGVLLGDEKGNFKPDADIKRSEIAAIINRVALPESRVKGTVNADWSTQGNEYDVEFNDEESLSKVEIGKAESAEIVGGALVLKPKFMGENASPKYDPQIGVNKISISAEDFTKLKVRLKVEFIGDIKDPKFDFYFMTDDGEWFSERKSIHKHVIESSVIDPFGWCILEVDFSTHKDWKGNITGFRFDPANTNGIYTVDYIRLVKADPLKNATHEELLAQGYTSTRLMQDTGWENGFYVKHFEQKSVDLEQRIWNPAGGEAKPVWDIGPWWSGIDLWENRVEGDKYVLADSKGVNTLIYNPEEKSISMRLNATKIYEGKPHDPNTYKWWPHLLLDQGYQSFAFDKVKNSINVDRMYIELDIRVTDFKNTTNLEGSNVCTYLAYFYLLSDKNPSAKIWYGINLFSGTKASTSTTPGWSPDSAAHMYMYGIPSAVVYGGAENSFTPENGKVVTGTEWKHVRVDITDHLDRCIEWANRDGAYGTGVKVSKEDMYFGGGNIGFEVHGNYDCTVEIKNVDIVSYKKAN